MDKHLKLMEYLSSNGGKERHIPIDKFLDKIALTDEKYTYEFLGTLSSKGYISYNDGIESNMFGDYGESTPKFTAKIEFNGTEYLNERKRNNNGQKIAMIAVLVGLLPFCYSFYQNSVLNEKDIIIKRLDSLNKEQAIYIRKFSNEITKMNVSKDSSSMRDKKNTSSSTKPKDDNKLF